jgi:ATP-dependent 26S proteasome regulatory subunit
VDVSAHAIFSRWFSESGKMVGKLFETIQALASDPDVLVCVLVDEVESLAASRTRTSAGSDPSDATRVVNAMLTQLDRLKSRANVLLLTTSNVTEVLDAAFLDRADVKLFIAHPTEEARYELLRSATLALLRVGVVLAPPSAGQSDVLPATLQAACTQCAQSPGALLSAVAKASEGLSGRALRKLPLLAYAKHLGASSTLAAPPSLEGFARAMLAAVQQELAALVKSL